MLRTSLSLQRLTARRALPALPVAAAARAMHSMPVLPYPDGALRPTLSGRAVSKHRKLSAQFYERLNTVLQGSAFEHQPLASVVAATSGDTQHAAIYNAASECWNDELYWSRLTPGGVAPPDELQEWVRREFGSFDQLEDKARAASLGACRPVRPALWSFPLQASPRTPALSRSSSRTLVRCGAAAGPSSCSTASSVSD